MFFMLMNKKPATLALFAAQHPQKGNNKDYALIGCGQTNKAAEIGWPHAQFCLLRANVNNHRRRAIISFISTKKLTSRRMASKTSTRGCASPTFILECRVCLELIHELRSRGFRVNNTRFCFCLLFFAAGFDGSSVARWIWVQSRLILLKNAVVIKGRNTVLIRHYGSRRN